MTSKEALEKLIEKTGIINDTCASLMNCIKCGKCRFEEPVETCNDYQLVMTIKQDLERLEELEKENQELKNDTELSVELIKDREQEILKLLKENQELKEKLTLGNSLSRGFIYNGKSLVLTTLENYKDIITENKKLTKAISILKDYIEYWTFGAEADFDTYVTSQCTDEGKDLLKEVFGDES